MPPHGSSPNLPFASSDPGTLPPPRRTPLQRRGKHYPSLASWALHNAPSGVPGGALAAYLVATPSCKGLSLRLHPLPLAEPLRGVVCAQRSRLATGAVTSGAGCGASGIRAPGSARAHPPLGGPGGAATRPRPPQSPSGPHGSRDDARTRTELLPLPPWRGRRAPANDGEGAARARRARPTPAAAL